LLLSSWPWGGWTTLLNDIIKPFYLVGKINDSSLILIKVGSEFIIFLPIVVYLCFILHDPLSFGSCKAFSLSVIHQISLKPLYLSVFVSNKQIQSIQLQLNIFGLWRGKFLKLRLGYFVFLVEFSNPTLIVGGNIADLWFVFDLKVVILLVCLL
jgi:hypothetical protein